MSLRRRASRGVKQNAIASVITAIAQVAQLALLARLLQPADFGVASIATMIIGFLALAVDLGMGSALVHARDLGQKDLSSVLWATLGLGASILLAMVLFSSPVAAFFDQPRLVPQLAWMGVGFAATSVGTVFRSVLERECAFGRLAAATSASALFGLAVAVSLAVYGSGAMAIAWGFLAAASLRTLLFAFLAVSFWKPQLVFEAAGVRRFVRFGSKVTGQRLVNYWSANLDFFLAGRFAGAQALGQYAIAYNLANLPSSQINVVLNNIFFPLFARVQDDDGLVRNGYLKLQSIASFLNFPLLTALAVLAPDGVPFLLGDRWRSAAALLQILCVVGLARSIGGTTGPLLLVKGRPGLGFRWSLILFGITAPALVAGMLLGGVRGMALAFAAAQLVAVCLNYVILVRTLVGPCLAAYLGTIFPALVASVAAGVVMALVASESFLRLGVSLLLGAGVYLFATFLVNPGIWEELRLLRRNATAPAQA